MKYFSILLFLFPFFLQAQTTEHSITHDGETRSYYMHLPPQYDGSTPLPVVFVLHGLGDSASNMLNTGFTVLGDNEGFISVYPQGLQSALGTAWNNGSNISLLGFTPDDKGFIENLIDMLVADHAADSDKIYTCGFSMGGIMSHYLGCNLSDKITAIASMAGPMATSVSNSCNASRSVPAMHIHGDADATVSYNGDATSGLASVATTIETWANHNNCGETPMVSSLPDTANDGLTITKTEYSNCDEETILLTVHGAGHIWLGPNNDISTTLEFWDFFKDKSMTAPTPVEENILKNISLQPNPVSDILYIKNLPGNASIQISGIDGRIISNHTNQNEIDMSTLVAGVYVVQITDEETGTRLVDKVVKS